jgi:hypothetical protein
VALLLTLCGAGVHAAPLIVPIHPEENGFVYPDELLVVASVALAEGDQLAGVDWESGTEVRLDDAAVSSGVSASPGCITWSPGPGGVPPGPHTVAVSIRSVDNTVLATGQWQFTVLERHEGLPDSAVKARSYEHNGRVFAEAASYVLGTSSTWELLAGGSYRATAGRVRWGAELLLTNLNTDSSQDRNVYRADIQYGRALRLRVGDTRPSFDPCVMTGQRVRGLELNARAFLPSGLNLVNLDIAYGQARRAAEPDTYKRTLFAGRLSFGSGRIFQLGLTFLKGRDDTASIRPSLDTLITVVDTLTTVLDTSLVEGATPEDNLAVGSDIRVRLLDGRLEFYGAYAFSLYTRDISDTVPVTRDHFRQAFGDDFDFDPEALGGLIILNQSSLPLYGGTGVLNSSYLSAGMRLRLPFPLLTEQFEFAYTLQGANYYSMGNSMLGTGEQGFSISDKVYLLSNRLAIDLAYGRYWNNLDGLQAEATVTNRFSVAASLFYSPKWPGVTVTYAHNANTNGDTAYGFDNGVNLLNLVGNYAYTLGRLGGAVQLFVGLSGVDNRWRSVSFDSSSGAVSQDTSAAFRTGVYGVNVQARLEGVPIMFSGGLMTNAGTDELLTMVSGDVDARFEIVPSLLSAHGGLRFGGTRMPDESDYSFNMRIPYGADFSHRLGHSVRFGGYVVANGTDWDLVNTLRYEWRF